MQRLVVHKLWGKLVRGHVCAGTHYLRSHISDHSSTLVAWFNGKEVLRDMSRSASATYAKSLCASWSSTHGALLCTHRCNLTISSFILLHRSKQTALQAPGFCFNLSHPHAHAPPLISIHAQSHDIKKLAEPAHVPKLQEKQNRNRKRSLYPVPKQKLCTRKTE